MMKDHLKLYGIAFLSVFLACAFGKSGSGQWIDSVMGYRTCVFLWTPLFLLGIAALEKGMHLYTMIRLVERKKVFQIQIAQASVLTVFYVLLWVGAQVLFSFVIYGDISWMDAEWFGYASHWFLGLIFWATVVIYFAQSQNPAISSNSCILTYALYVLDVMVLTPMADQQLPVDFHFFFNRMFVPSGKNAVILCVLILMAVLMSGKRQKRKDVGI